MLATLSAIVLITGGLIGTAQPTIPTCSFIVGGFLNEPLSPGEAVQQARNSIWNVYREHAETCIDLRIYARPGVTTDVVFRSQQRDGVWQAAIMSAPKPVRVEQRSGSFGYKDVERIERIEPLPGGSVKEIAPRGNQEYSLLFHLKDGSTLEF